MTQDQVQGFGTTAMSFNNGAARAADRRVRGDVAIIGMAALFPGAPNLTAYWQNILGKVDAITEPPSDAWGPTVRYDSSSAEGDGVYCERGGYLGPFAFFDPLEHGVMPLAVEGSEPDQWLALKMARAALADAGYHDQQDIPRRTAVIIGKGTYISRGNVGLLQHSTFVDQTLGILKGLHPHLGEEDLRAIRQELKRQLPPSTPETVPGLIPNIIAGRVANRLDLTGPSYTVDAACASSLIAVQMAQRDLLTAECDIALVGGAQVTTPNPIFSLFCQLNALSRRQQIRPFDRDADGTILGEGIGMIVLKRRDDAERDGDRIYAILKGVGVSSDGRAVSVMAPRVEGQELALQRAYENADVDPSTVDLIEGHGTGTPVGDAVEIESLDRVLGPRVGSVRHRALGSVKSMIGHTMPAAGIAGLIKATLALYHRVLPPTLNVSEPNPRLESDRSAIYLNTDVRPWVHGGSRAPRRAGVNAFGFGGINAHAVLEEYPHAHELDLPTHQLEWESEALILRAASPTALVAEVDRLLELVAQAPSVALRDLAYSLNTQEPAACQLGIVASDLDDLRQKLERARQRLSDARCRQIKDVSGIYYFSEPLAREGKVAVLFPGEGAQYAGMLADLCVHFPEVRAAFDDIDRVFSGHARGYRPSDVIFPPSLLPMAERVALEQHLWQIDGAVESVLTANQALWTLMTELGLKPDMIVGHSTGEYSAMRAAGVLDLSDQEVFARFVREMNRGHQEVATRDGVPPAAMLAVGAEREQVATVVARIGGALHVAMDNCPHQSVIVGPHDAIEAARTLVQKHGWMHELLNFERAYHTPLFAPYTEHLRRVFAELPVQAPSVPIYSCTTAAAYPSDPSAIRTLMVEHWVRPVEFRRTIDALYAEGVRLFVEVGPRGNLTSFVEDTLRGQPFCAVPANVQRRTGISQLNHCVALLAAHGVDLTLMSLYQRRRPQRLSWGDGSSAAVPQPSSVEPKLATGFPILRPTSELVQLVRSGTPMVVPSHHPSDSAYQPLPSGGGDGHASQQGAATAREEGGLISPASAESSGAEDKQVVTRSGPSAAAHSPADPDGAFGAPAMQDFLHTMEQFLAVQAEVMQAYLHGAGAASLSAGAPPPRSAPSLEMLAPSETVVSVERGVGGPADSSLATPVPVQEVPLPAWRAAVVPNGNGNVGPDAPLLRQEVGLPASEGGSPSRTELTERLLALVSDRTGYPTEMLGLDADLEADLGIDSIKRVEILGALRRQYDGLGGVPMERLSEQRTLHQIIELVCHAVADGEPAVSTNPPVSQARPASPLEGGSPATLRYPLLGDLVSRIPGEELIAQRTFDPAEDLYLRDHTFGRAVSAVDSDLLALAVMPLTMSLEVMAEAASALMPNRPVVGLRDVRAYRWIAFDGQPQTLQIRARRAPGSGNDVFVRIRNLTEDGESIDPPKSPVLEATVIVADSYPIPPTTQPRDLEHARPSRWRADRLYRDGMFHGPSWQGVAAIEQTGDDGIAATLKVLPFVNFFRSGGDPRFVLDPVALDAAGQVIAFWTLEHLSSRQVIFPFRLEALEVYGPQRPTGDSVRCLASVQLVGEQQLRSDIDLIADDGRPWMRLVGWVDKRFDLPSAFYSLILATGEAELSTAWPEAIARLPRPELLECRLVSAAIPSDGGFWKRVWAQCILSRSEREQFRGLQFPEGRQLAWLAGRAAAKEAVRHLLQQQYGLKVPPADIEICPDERGRPLVDGPWRESVSSPPIVSLAHSDGLTVALAGSPESIRGMGVDVEHVRPRLDGFANLAFSEEELQLLKYLPLELHDEWMLRWWCAKEAAAKATGFGLIEGPRSVVVVGMDPSTERVSVQLAGQLARVRPDLVADHLLVYTGRQDDLVFAATLCEPASYGVVGAIPVSESSLT